MVVLGAVNMLLTYIAMEYFPLISPKLINLACASLLIVLVMAKKVLGGNALILKLLEYSVTQAVVIALGWFMSKKEIYLDKIPIDSLPLSLLLHFFPLFALSTLVFTRTLHFTDEYWWSCVLLLAFTQGL